MKEISRMKIIHINPQMRHMMQPAITTVVDIRPNPSMQNMQSPTENMINTLHEKYKAHVTFGDYKRRQLM